MPLLCAEYAMKFYLGVSKPHWLALAGVPLFISRATMSQRDGIKPAVAPWALDSGGFSELSIHGKWRFTAKQYAAEVRTWSLMVGKPDFVAIMDWMCEPFVLKKTGLTTRDHQQRTIDSYLELTSLDSNQPWMPVIQGYTLGEYLSHVEQYDKAGIDLRLHPVVGLGSICRRQSTTEAERIIGVLHKMKLKIHGFGFKKLGLLRCAGQLQSADSQAWAMFARYRKAMSGCKHRNCANCLRFALKWRSEVISLAGG